MWQFVIFLFLSDVLQQVLHLKASKSSVCWGRLSDEILYLVKTGSSQRWQPDKMCLSPCLCYRWAGETAILKILLTIIFGYKQNIFLQQLITELRVLWEIFEKRTCFAILKKPTTDNLCRTSWSTQSLFELYYIKTVTCWWTIIRKI